MVPVCLLGLIGHQPFIWVICPQALVVMFVRQSLRAYDSLGAAHYPDLVVAALYYPIVGWILSQDLLREELRPTAVRTAIWHVVAIGFAVGTAMMRNWLWELH